MEDKLRYKGLWDPRGGDGAPPPQPYWVSGMSQEGCRARVGDPRARAGTWVSQPDLPCWRLRPA